MKFDNISDAYAILEIYDYGDIDRQIYVQACNYALEHFRKKYGKDSFWFRELFACKQDDEWEQRYEVRSLVHAELIGCPHEGEGCEEYKTDGEKMSPYYKDKSCQHCRHIEGVEEKWKEKDQS